MRYERYMLASFTASTMVIGAWIKFNVGPIPYTLQNFGVVLASLLMDPLGATFSVLLYVAMIAVGLPVAAGFKGGPHILFGYTAGYIWGFVLSAPLVSILYRTYLKTVRKYSHELRSVDIAVLTALASLGMLPTYILGYLVFRFYALSSAGLLSWAEAASGFFGLHNGVELTIFSASILIFLPQDVLIDHLMAVITFTRLCSLLSSRGIVIESCLCK
ncbi:MAG: biotin transporter BioY [Desulfurococcaceae archaeon TW002]